MTITEQSMKEAKQMVQIAFLVKRIASLKSEIVEKGRAMCGSPEVRKMGTMYYNCRRLLEGLLPVDGASVEADGKTLKAVWNNAYEMPSVCITEEDAQQA